MSLGSLHIVPHRTRPAPNTRLALFWLGFAALLVLATLAFATAQQTPPEAPRNQGGGLFGVLRDVEPTTPPPDTPSGPTNTPLPPPPSNTPVDTVVPPTVVTLVPSPTEGPPTVTDEPATPILTSTPPPTDTPVPPTATPIPTTAVPQPTPTTPPPPATITPTPIVEVTEPSPVPPTLTSEATAIPPITVVVPSDTPGIPTVGPTVDITSTPSITVTEAPGGSLPTSTDLPAVRATIQPPPSPEPVPTNTPDLITSATPITTSVPSKLVPTRTRVPTATSTVIGGIPITPTTISTPDLTATVIEQNATATGDAIHVQETVESVRATASAAANTANNPGASQSDIATAIAAGATAESALATAVPIGIQAAQDTPRPVFEQAMTATLAANAGAPILVYTYTQQTNANGEHIIAACIWNLGTVAATDVDVQFNARSPAMFTAGRIPAEQSEFDDQQVKVRIANLNPKTLRQIEVGVENIDDPLPKWVTVSINGAYALNHRGDPAFPAACTPSGIQSAASDNREVQIEVGGLYDAVNARIQAEQERTVNPGVFSLTIREQGPPAFSSFALYCVIGLILALLLIVSLLAGERRKRVKPTRRQQRASF